MSKAKSKIKNYSEVQDLIKNNSASKKYFFDNINSEWFYSLQEADVFQPALSLSETSDDGYYQDWIEGRYLLRISNDLPQEVYDVIVNLDFGNYTNPLIYEIVTEIVVNVADRVDVAKMVDIIINNDWIEEKGRAIFMSSKLKDLVAKLILKRDFNLLNKLLITLLSFNLPEDYLEIAKKRFPEPIPLIEIYSLEEILEELSKIKFANKEDLDMILETLVVSFDKYLTQTKSVKEYKENDEYEDYSFIWKPSIDYENNGLHNIKEDFVISIRDLLINNTELADSKTYDVLLKSKKRIFKRIKLFIYSKADILEDITVQEINDNIEDRHNIGELRLLLISKFNSFTEENKSEILNRINDSFADLDVEERFKIIYKSELLKPISIFLTKEQKKKYKSFIQNKHEYIPSYRLNGVRFGPNSRYSKEELLEKSHKQLVGAFIENQKLFEEDIHNEEMYSPRGLGRLWQSIVVEKFEDYQENLEIYDPSKILPVYISHLLNGIAEVTGNDKKVNWSKILKYLEYLLKLYEEGSFIESKVKDSFDVGDKEEVIVSILRLLENGFRGKNLIPLSLRNKTWKIISKISVVANDTDESFVEKNDKDYFTNSINSIGGLILHNVYSYGFWVANKKKLQSYPVEVVEFISSFIDEHIDYKTGVSVMGKYLPWTQMYSITLFNKQKEKLLSIDDKDIRYIAWETYLANPIFIVPYQELRDVYIQSINELNQDIPDRMYWSDPKNSLLEHIMVGYIHKLDTPDYKESLFDILLKTKSTKHIAYAINFVGRAYTSSDNEKKKNLKKDQINQIKKIWEIVLDKCKDPEIFENFGWWVRKDYYGDNQWLLEVLNKTLEKSNGYIAPDFRVLGQLSLLASEYPLLVANALDKMVKSSKKEKTYYFRDKEVGLIIETLENKSIDEVTFLTKDIRDTLVGYGYTQYSK